MAEKLGQKLSDRKVEVKRLKAELEVQKLARKTKPKAKVAPEAPAEPSKRAPAKRAPAKRAPKH